MNDGYAWKGWAFAGALEFQLFDDGMINIQERPDGWIIDESTGESVMVNGGGQNPLTYYQLNLKGVAVPEPQTALLFITGFSGFIGSTLRRKNG